MHREKKQAIQGCDVMGIEHSGKSGASYIQCPGSELRKKRTGKEWKIEKGRVRWGSGKKEGDGRP